MNYKYFSPEKIKVSKTYTKFILKVKRGFNLGPCIPARLVYGNKCHKMKESEYCDYCKFYKMNEIKYLVGSWK